MADFDVVIAGAGPTGLMLACELRLGGAKVLVAERREEVDETIKAMSVNSPSAVALYRRGFHPTLAGIQERAMAGFQRFSEERGEDLVPPPRFAGHFAGIPLDAAFLDPDDPAWADTGRAEEIGLIPQAELERVLAARARELGVEVRRGVELTGFEEGGADGGGVSVRLTEPHADTDASISTGDTRTVRAGWLVGCDGGRSTVRKLAGFDFPGTPPEITGYQAVADMTGTEALATGWNTTATGTYAHGPLPGRILTVEFDGPPADRTTPVTAAELQAGVRRVTGVEVTVEKVRTATRFTDNCRQASDYRKGRVLLAGDAAHVHSPFGGQGLNLGIGDAVNLGWKLAAVVRGWAPPTLLDSYTAERHPIGAWVLDWTRAQIALMRPESHARALREVFTDLTRTVDGTTYLVKKISGVWQRYALPGDHPLVGASAPDLELSDSTRLADHLHTARGLLLDLADDPKLRARAEDYGDRLTILTATCADRPGLAALLVRPDGFTAWAADTEPAGAGGEPLEAALERWFGTPDGVPEGAPDGSP
ncbi:FAD-dependent monooxygenase [Streptomyces acidiscabies]|uniref:FAD-dependent monooxygenase n=1 Tax=Streptomyces acidiscabies TaxID=42234 RepID=A0AAP6EDM0_9ACTN|nr:FAD-dependent monooxygenase [Streptomyces acidiscabies]MBP5939942.1 FAD-dependent oxidoreductase [Streptomyces sp. LBUM 1476]MBZ3911132.1 FAD-dependent monooxygenase [Streptomyces acidiscabies]MDX2959087.1 FAD-dependent monooxygenase [Streptomyces acidiscabies]MDX3023935.1 FAD-dependent monooxygenase [Streptomyces acidiscabies]MDX3788244.1 FAD-dependent monooxygenase [Streptomyces acidiscabies]